KAFLTGKGRIVVRGVAKIEADPKTNKTVIIVTELPYVVKKADLVEKTAHLINNKVINGISSLRDESDRQGLRIVYELKRDATPNVVLNNLYKHTALQSSFNVNNVALVDGVPKLLNLKDFIHYYVVHRHRVVTRRTQAACDKARQQRHLLQGYLVVGEHVNEVVKLIKSSKDGVTAKQRLMEGYGLSEVQAKSVLEMRLQRLTGLERAKITQQYQETERTIENLEGILGDRGKRMEIIKEELGAFAQRYGDDRRTQIVHDAREMVIKDMIPNERMVITLSQQGYIKATPLAIYKSQQRGGVGAKGVSSKKEDVLSQLFVASAHDHLLIFTSFGKVYWQHVYSLPQGGKNARGRAIQNVLEIAPGDEVRSILKVKTLSDPAYVSNLYVTLCTAKGIIKKVRLEAFSRPLRRGIRAISFKEGDRLVEAQLTRPGDHIIMGVKSGKAIRFHQNEVRAMGRTAAGVRGISIDCNDEVIGMLSTSEKSDVTLLVISEKGYGKRSSIETYRITRRGGKGVKTLQVTPKTGTLIAIKAVQKTDELIAMNKSGITLRTNISSLRTAGRNTQGVRVVRLVKQDRIASVAIIKELEEKPDV
ncbi:MAG: DNA gyrase subunit A, partial [Cytophagales bacterium]